MAAGSGAHGVVDLAQLGPLRRGLPEGLDKLLCGSGPNLKGGLRQSLPPGQLHVDHAVPPHRVHSGKAEGDAAVLRHGGKAPELLLCPSHGDGDMGGGLRSQRAAVPLSGGVQNALFFRRETGVPIRRVEVIEGHAHTS